MAAGVRRVVRSCKRCKGTPAAARTKKDPREAGLAGVLRGDRRSVTGLEAGGEGGLERLGKLELGESAVNLGLVETGAAVFEADAERTAVGRQGGEGEAPALGFGETLAQFALVADGDAGLFQGIQELVEGFVAQTTHFWSPLRMAAIRP